MRRVVFNLKRSSKYSVFSRRWRHLTLLQENFQHLFKSWERLMERENEGCSCWVSIGWHSLSISLCYLKLGSISCDDSFLTDHCKKWERERHCMSWLLCLCADTHRPSYHSRSLLFIHATHWGLKAPYHGKLAFSCSFEVQFHALYLMY